MRTRVHRRLLVAVCGVCFFMAGASVNPAPGATSAGDPLELFSQLMPVFGHPRCVNCHGGVNPFYEYTGPPMVEHTMGVIGDPNVPPSDRAEECRDCHNETKEIEDTWFLATLNGSQLNWLGKSTKELCDLQAHEVRRMKKAARTWIAHLHEDTLITQAFDGRAGGQLSPADPPKMKRPYLEGCPGLADAGASCSTWAMIRHGDL
jgi:hypothetical protein